MNGILFETNSILYFQFQLSTANGCKAIGNGFSMYILSTVQYSPFNGMNANSKLRILTTRWIVIAIKPNRNHLCRFFAVQDTFFLPFASNFVFFCVCAVLSVHAFVAFDRCIDAIPFARSHRMQIQQKKKNDLKFGTNFNAWQMSLVWYSFRIHKT